MVEKVKELEGRAGQRADVVVVSCGFHFLHVWPDRPFEYEYPPGYPWAGMPKSQRPKPKSKMNGARHMARYQQHIDTAVEALRGHVGRDGLVVWKTNNDICDAK